MGYVARYRQEAQEKNLPHWNRFVIAQAGENTQEAIIAQQGWNTPDDPQFPKRFPSYEEAFAWLECKLTNRCSATAGTLRQIELFQPDVLSVKAVGSPSRA